MLVMRQAEHKSKVFSCFVRHCLASGEFLQFFLLLHLHLFIVLIWLQFYYYSSSSDIVCFSFKSFTRCFLIPTYDPGFCHCVPTIQKHNPVFVDLFFRILLVLHTFRAYIGRCFSEVIFLEKQITHNIRNGLHLLWAHQDLLSHTQ